MSHRSFLSWRLEAERAIRPNVAVKTAGLDVSEPEGPLAGANAMNSGARLGFLQRFLVAETGDLRTARSRKTYNTVVFSRDFMRPEANKQAIRT